MPTGFFLPTQRFGEIEIDGVTYPVQEQAIAYSVVAATQQIAAVPGAELWLVSYSLVATLNCEMEWRSDTTVVRGPIWMSPRVEYGRDFALYPWMKTAVGEGLFFRQEQAEAAVVRGVVHYAEVVP